MACVIITSHCIFHIDQCFSCYGKEFLRSWYWTGYYRITSSLPLTTHNAALYLSKTSLIAFEESDKAVAVRAMPYNLGTAHSLNYFLWSLSSLTIQVSLLGKPIILCTCMILFCVERLQTFASHFDLSIKLPAVYKMLF